ncbi:hypothetical protein K3556_04310 [Aliiroseovarius sp. M344]|uniref:hypothetical protein n=1 Tax=Aliiroseovarius sp. M344 TaxID=2867010 RepID=UPI0021AE03D0|nr:hypothetical protein [Aliiroseovarius sp. M344]UWQ15124.1 hypothetical protein K3556_04310 [Aliiroseovarius sp. M344]
MVALEKWQIKKDMCERELVEIEIDLVTEKEEGIRKLLFEDKAHAQKTLSMLGRLLAAIRY